MRPPRTPRRPLTGARRAAMLAVQAVLVLPMLCPAPAAAQRGTDSRTPQALLTNPAGASDSPASPWRLLGLPRQSKPFTRFGVQTVDGQRALRVEANASYGNLVHELPDLPAGAHRLRWQWRLDEPNLAADLRRKEGDDSPIKVCALFDLPTSALPFTDRQLLRLARLRAGETLPAAVVCYTWDSRLPAGTVLDNAFTRRIRTIVLRGPDAPLHTWLAEQRDVAADFLRLFGDEATSLVPLVGVLVGADADNTGGHSLAYVAGMSLD